MERKNIFLKRFQQRSLTSDKSSCERDVNILRRKNDSQHGCRVLLTVFYVFGLSFVKNRVSKNVVFKFLQVVLVLYMHVILLTFIIQRMQALLRYDSIRKSSYSFLFYSAISFSLWTFTFLKRKAISTLVNAVFKLKKNCQKTNQNIFSFIIPMLTIFNFLASLASMPIFIQNKDLQYRYMREKLGYSAFCIMEKLGITRVCFFIYAFSAHCFLNLIQNLLALLCSWIFLELGKALKQCEDMLLCGKPLENMYRIYHCVIRVKSMMEAKLGFIILLVSLSGLFILFTFFSGILGDSHDQFIEKEMMLITITHMLIRIIYLLVLVFSAAEVSERDKSFRRAIVSHSLTRKRNNLDLMFLSSIDESAHLSFSVCGYFELTRGFIASAVGIFLTYTMLFLQLEKKQ